MIGKLLTLSALAGSAALAAAAVSEKPIVAEYTVRSGKISTGFRLLHLSDLHSSSYGEREENLIGQIDSLCPDAVMLTGDIADNRVPNGNAYALAAYIGKKYRCFYVEGNHEVYTGRAAEIKARFRSYGFTVLEGGKSRLAVGKELITVCGIDDPYGLPDAKGRMWEEQLSDCSAFSGNDSFSILLTHRPEPVDFYKETGFDLILAGHAHGGQVILPGILNGLYAPHQGWFPKYAGGRYDLGGKTMIVSRGLSKYVKPRIFNRPELVLIRVIPE